MQWQRLALDATQRARFEAAHDKRFDRVDINGWSGFVARDDGSAPDQGFIIEPADPKRPRPAALTWVARDAERLLVDTGWLETPGPALIVVDDDVSITGWDAAGVWWTVTWPDGGTRLGRLRRTARALAGGIIRRPMGPRPTTQMRDCVAYAKDVDGGVFEARWGLPHYEEYDGLCTAGLPEHHWNHTLADTTRAQLVYVPDTRDAMLLVDPGDAARALRALGLTSPPWQCIDEGTPIVDANHAATGPWAVMRQDDAGNAFVARRGLSEGVARRWVEVYEARGHKQTYWVERASTAGDRDG